MKCFVSKVCSKVLLGFLIVSIMACGGGTSGTGGDNTSINLRQFEGTVVDSNQKPIPNVSVVVEETGDTTVTDSQGKFEIASEVGQEAVLIFNGPTVNTTVSVTNLVDNSKPAQISVVVDKNTGTVDSEVDKNPKLPELPDSRDSHGCITLYKPVCATNGNTYGNSCEADKEGATVAYEGECRQQSTDGPYCLQVIGKVCGVDGKTYDSYCHAAEAGVGVSHQGICGAPTCSNELKPVCGADGYTYGNACEANKAGTTVSYEGECRQQSIGGPNCVQVIGKVCGVDGKTYDSACHAAEARVGIAHRGICGAPTCSNEFKPVCGADGYTYGNACEAIAGGTVVQRDGDCSANELF